MWDNNPIHFTQIADNYSRVFVFFINFFGQLKDWVGQVFFLVSCLKGQVKKYVNVEVCLANNLHFIVKLIDKAIVINAELNRNERKRLYSSNKVNLTC